MSALQEWWSSKFDLEPKSIGLLLLVSIVTVTIYVRTASTSSKHASTADLISSKNNNANPSITKNFASAPVKNDVWEERKKRGIFPASMNKKEDAGEKPFGSSYYYAHNNTTAKGGYSDGLRMEDYTMNGPRLLSVSGKPVVQEEQKEENALPEPQQGQQEQLPPASASSKPIVFHKDITRYLWDDPGDTSGIATIWIDTLPGRSSTETVSWKDAKIKTVDANLKDDGLLVIATGEDEQTYRLKISKLFDEAVEVRTVVKPKRLLVKIHKKRNALNFLGKSNLEPWPHPQRKHK